MLMFDLIMRYHSRPFAYFCLNAIAGAVMAGKSSGKNKAIHKISGEEYRDSFIVARAAGVV
jgi:hypothetical protein